MTSTLRGVNSRLSARLRRREDAERSQASEAAEEAQAANPEATGPETQEVSDAEKAALSEFTVAQLKERLTTLGQPTSGKKADLIARLLEAAK